MSVENEFGVDPRPLLPASFRKREMNQFKYLLAALMAVLAPSATSVAAQDANVKSRGLFVNLTTEDTWSAAKADGT